MRRLIPLLALFFCFSANALTIGSWNMKHLGWADDKRDWPRTAEVAAKFDFLALQEVHNEDSLERLESVLEKQTGVEWDSLVSHKAVGRTRYKELYAFIWQTNKVSYEGGAVVYLDPGDIFEREPFAARFSERGGKSRKWTAATAHLIYGKTVSRREAEARQLDEYAQWLIDEVAQGSPVLVMGDFNLPPQSTAFNGLRKMMKPLITTGKTTLSSHNGKFANLYDNIWTNSGLYKGKAGIYRFPAKLGVTHEYARKAISDHAPVYLIWD